MIVWVNIVLNRTIVDSDWRFDNLCGSHCQSHSELYHVSKCNSGYWPRPWKMPPEDAPIRLRFQHSFLNIPHSEPLVSLLIQVLKTVPPKLYLEFNRQVLVWHNIVRSDQMSILLWLWLIVITLTPQGLYVYIRDTLLRYNFHSLNHRCTQVQAFWHRVLKCDVTKN